MTTIAYKGGVIASDSLMSQSGTYIDSHAKVKKLKGGIIIGHCGDSDMRGIFNILSIIKSPDQVPASRELIEAGVDCECIVVFPSKQMFLLMVIQDSSNRKEAHFVELNRKKFYAIGSGRDHALGAMAAGKSAKEAVVIACQFDLKSGLPVHTLPV